MKIHVKKPSDIVRVTINRANLLGMGQTIMLEEALVNEVLDLLEDIFYQKCRPRLPKGFGPTSSHISIVQEEISKDPGPGNRVKSANLYVFDLPANVHAYALNEIKKHCAGLRKPNRPSAADMAELKARKRVEALTTQSKKK